ncbi:MAG: ribosome recycling factor [Helicobacteraceae bacterium]|jgi:ribosome recycling factor|nr:ribosome recycling factor [Helicobacteraceae bacterium]
MLQSIFDDAKAHMQKCLDSLAHDFTTIRTGKVSPKILEAIKIDYYGSPTPINTLGNVTTPDANTIVVTPWEKNLVKDIEKAIAAANIGVNPGNNGAGVILAFPPMTSEQRKEAAKHAKAMSEKAKVAARNVRQDANNKVKKLEKDKTITEDESKKAHDTIQKITDDAIAAIDKKLAEKEGDILKI